MRRIYTEIGCTSFSNANRAHELCESRGGRAGPSVPNSPYGLCGHKLSNIGLQSRYKELLRSCVKVEVVVLGLPSLIVLMVSVGIKQH